MNIILKAGRWICKPKMEVQKASPGIQTVNILLEKWFSTYHVLGFEGNNEHS